MRDSHHAWYVYAYRLHLNLNDPNVVEPPGKDLRIDLPVAQVRQLAEAASRSEASAGKSIRHHGCHALATHPSFLARVRARSQNTHKA